MADENIGVGHKLAQDEVMLGEGDLRFGSGPGTAADLVLNLTAYDTGSAASTENRGCELGELLDYEKKVSGDGISLFVEFSGPASKCSGLHYAMKDEDLGMDEENDERGSFSVGDVVWIKTKSRSWWPGKILNPLDASVDTMEANRGRLLVTYLGSIHVSWCLTSQLKSFHKNFAEVAKQNKSRSFTGAFEKAVHEFGKRLMEKLTLERENDVNSLLVEFGEYSSILFEPGEFLLKLKFLAVSLTRPYVLDFVVMKHYLPAFYSSIGHENKSMHLLLLEADVEDDTNEIPRKRSTVWKKSSRKMKVGVGETGIGGVEAIDTGSLPPSSLNSDGFIDEKSEMGSESRSRKTSKYLSYPYISYVNKELAGETGKNVCFLDSREAVFVRVPVNGFVGSPALVKCTRKKLLRLHPKKFEYPPPDPSRLTPAEFLSDIGSLAWIARIPVEVTKFMQLTGSPINSGVFYSVTRALMRCMRPGGGFS
ncbi:hypothetical protein MLD38_032014 [Melastoma candidum]|uniref:Uncharacterized protein n=1 Tax=Melastoma candidum TaxID=119954 RepID=A0ACB9MT76_9MYRT|nr:hypothetical protein MLD38_032014 [Melastoma candidum]